MNKLHSNKLALNSALTAQYLQNDFGYPSEPPGYAGYIKKNQVGSEEKAGIRKRKSLVNKIETDFPSCSLVSRWID